MPNRITFQLYPTPKLNTDDTFPGTEVAHCEDRGSLKTLKLNHRMRTLEIKGDLEYIKQVTSGSHGAAPNLQSLEIYGASIPENSSHRFDSSFNFLRNPVPSLRVLSFLSVLLRKLFGDRSLFNSLGNPVPSLRELTFWKAIPLKLFTLPNLTTIGWMAPLATVDFKELLDSLAATPLLEDLMIDVKITPSNDPNTLKKKVTLDELTNLRWIDNGGSTSLIPHLVASKLQNLHISVWPLNERGTTLASILTPDHPNDIGLFQIEPVEMHYHFRPASSGWLRPQPSELGYRLLCPNGGKVYFEIRGDFETDYPLPDLPFSLSNTNIFTAVTYFEKPLLGSIPIQQLTNLKTLTLKGKTTSLIPLLEPNNSDKLVPFPHLEQALIDINQSDSIPHNLTTLRDALQKRNEEGLRLRTLKIAFPRYGPKHWCEYVNLVDEVEARVDKFHFELHTH